jgi:hypothetical protein
VPRPRASSSFSVARTSCSHDTGTLARNQESAGRRSKNGNPANGKRFCIRCGGGINDVLNWFEELKQKVSTGKK